MLTTTTDTTAMVTSGGLPPIKETIGPKGWRTRLLLGRSFGSALAMSLACGATMVVASQLRSGSPWAGLNAMATAVGLGPKKAKKRFDATATLAGAGVLTAGFLVFAGLYEGVLAASGRRRSLATGLLAAVSGFAVDELLLRRELVPNFRRTLGNGGTIAKYAALGIAAAR